MKTDYELRVEASLAKIQTIEIHKLEDVFQLITEQPFNSDIKRNRSPFFYRGLSNSKYSLQTSLQRNCGEKRRQLEECMLRNFAKYAMETEHGARISASDWNKLIIGQHHGLPTRLLDWTHSTLVALHFADSENDLADLDRRNCAVWRIDARELNSKLPQKYQDALAEKHTFIFSVKEMLRCGNCLAARVPTWLR